MKTVAPDDRGDLLARDEHVGEVTAHAVRELGRHHRNVSDVRTFSWSFKIPCINISGLGGQPGT